LYFFLLSFMYKVLQSQMQTLNIISPLSHCVVLGGSSERTPTIKPFWMDGVSTANDL
jgi:hypothetical protein